MTSEHSQNALNMKDKVSIKIGDFLYNKRCSFSLLVTEQISGDGGLETIFLRVGERGSDVVKFHTALDIDAWIARGWKVL